MDDKRQKIQMELALTARTEGETRVGASGGIESSKAERETESPTLPERSMEEVVRPENLKAALKRVRSNKGSPGIDGMTVDELPDYLTKHWPVLREQLLNGTYKPTAVKRVEIEKPDGGMRRLGIPTVRDRFIQQAVMQVLQSGWDRTFSQHSYGFRPGRSAHQAVAKAQGYIAEGLRYVVDIDLERFFDRVNHDKLMGRLARHVADKRMLKIIRAFLNAGVMENGLVSPTGEGTPQGGPLSPLLSNIVLDELDRELEKRGHRFVRYADDCNIYVHSERAGQRVMESVKGFIAKKLKLKVNDKKSAVARPKDRKFLGFSFTFSRQPKRRIAPQAVERFKKRVRELTRRTRGVSIETMAGELAVYLKGWQGYFSYCQTPSVFRDLDYWVKRRLRCVVWKQWKRGRVRFDELRKRGVGRELAAKTAGSAHGPWHLAWSPALHVALPDAYFVSLGLPRLTVTSNV